MTPADPDSKHNPAEEFPRHRHQSGDGNWNPYESAWTDTGPVLMQVQTVSALAILSLISGIVSIPMICLCFFALPFSLFAIVAGHISRSICGRSQGRVTGGGMAIAGLSLGYFSLILIVAMFVFMFAAQARFPAGGPGMPGPGTTPPWTTTTDGEEGLQAAIASVGSTSSPGNSDVAIELATHLQASLHDIAQQMQNGDSSHSVQGAGSSANVENDPTAESASVIVELPEAPQNSALQLALQESNVYGCLKSDSCAFLVGIGNLSDLNEADRIVLSQIVWLAAGRTVGEQLEAGQSFGVALIADRELQEISLGTYERSDHYDAGLEHRVPSYDYEKRMQLSKFFETDELSSDPESAGDEASDTMLEFPSE